MLNHFSFQTHIFVRMITMKIVKNSCIVALILGVMSCSSPQQKENQVDEANYCECVELFFDDDYNHFYLQDRTVPFSGKCEEINVNGVVVVEKNFEKGKLMGAYLEYYNSGVLKNEWNFLNNRQHGDQKLYDETGKLTHHSIYKKGELDSIVFSVYPIVNQ